MKKKAKRTEPSPAWLKLMRKAEAALVESAPAQSLPSPRCRCFEPWIGGHEPRCPLWQARCADCGIHNGLHRYGCRYWVEHPERTPF